MASPKLAKTYVKDVVIVCPGGLIRSTGNLKPLRTSETADSFCMLCPQCDDPTRVHQLYTCDNGHKDMEPNEITGRGMQVGDVLHSLTGDEVDAARKVAKSQTLELMVHPADKVEAEMRPTGLAYAFLPVMADDPFYGVLVELADSMGDALMGKLVVRGKIKRFRLVREPFGLALVELCPPEEMYAFEVQNTSFDPAHMKVARDLINAARRDFDPYEYRDETADRVAAIIESKTTGTPVVTITPVAPAPQVDILAALEASLAAVKGEAA